RRCRGRERLDMTMPKSECRIPKECQSSKAEDRLETPGRVENPWPELASSWRMLLPLLGERAGVRAGVSVHLTSLRGRLQGPESGQPWLRAAHHSSDFGIRISFGFRHSDFGLSAV